MPCEVLYFKDSEAPGERQVLWSATNEAGYCETQAQGFVAKLEGLGWECAGTPGSPAPAADIQEQIALIDAARAAVAAGSGDRALTLVHRYQSKYPRGSFRPEAAALKIEALSKLGRNAEARRLAEKFVADHGGGPLADRVRRLGGLDRP